MNCTFDKRPSIFIRDKPILLDEDYDRMGSVGTKKKKNMVINFKGLDAKTN
jgi:hypothetical protein